MVIFACFLSFFLMVKGQMNSPDTVPQKGDFAESKMSPTQKQAMLDEHNKARSEVHPQAANMEYQIWSDDLANLAQMWTNKCIWGHGFLQFGPNYPREPKVATKKEKIGQNLARVYGKTDNPEERVTAWDNEQEVYHYTKHPPNCPKMCTHYTQMIWARSKYVGCGMKLCKSMGSGYQPEGGQTLVGCDYAPGGNMYGDYPYKLGTPCSKCASGYGWCFKNLCRHCKDYSLQCGKPGLTKDMCKSEKQKMTKFCPKMCGLCECPLKCQRGGTLNLSTCTCTCPAGYRPPDCSEKCEDFSEYNCKKDKEDGQRCDLPYMQEKCPKTCGICDDESSTSGPENKPEGPESNAGGPESITGGPGSNTGGPETNTGGPESNTGGPGSNTGPPETNTGGPESNAVGLEVETSGPENQPTPTLPETFPQPTPLAPIVGVDPKCADNNSQCPLWADQLECETNRRWMLENCKTSCNQCKECEDLLETCPDMALRGLCSKSPDKMLTSCRRSCGLCRVYDKEKWCPAWAAKGYCTQEKHWAWMLNNCPKSCDLPLSGHQYCATKPDGSYPTPITCKGYIQCSSGWTKYQACPQEKSFEKDSNTCRLSENILCESQVIPGSVYDYDVNRAAYFNPI